MLHQNYAGKPADLENRNARVVKTTTWLVQTQSPKHRNRRSFERFAKLKAQRSAIELHRLERDRGVWQ